MAPGTSPSITRLTNGSFRIAFAAGIGELRVHDLTSSRGTGLLLWPGTSPSITADTRGGWVIAAQANSSRLWTIDSAGRAIETPSAMNTSTSPSITTKSNGSFQIAFISSSGDLWVQDATSGHSTGIIPGSNPSIAADNRGGWTIAFRHAATGTLWTLDPVGHAADTRGAVAAGSSPSITALLTW
jgi:hypothetical protein